MRQLADNVRHHSRRAGRVSRGLFTISRRQLRRLSVGLVVFAALLELAQVFYPANRTLPFVSAGSQGVGNRSVSQVTDQLNKDYEKAVLIVATDDKRFERSFADLKATVATDKAAQEAANYPFWQRLIPFSSVAIMATRDTTVRTTFDQARIKDFAQAVQGSSSTAAKDATLRVDGDKVRVVDAIPAKDYPAKQVTAAIAAATITPRTVAQVRPHTTSAEITGDEATASAKRIQELLDARLVVSVGDEQTTVDAETAGGWLVFGPNAEKNGVKFAIKPGAPDAFLQSIQGSVYKKPGTTRIQLIDDREVSRTVGAAGRGINSVTATSALDQAIRQAGDSTVQLPVGDLPPVIAYDKQYSNSDKALAGAVSAAGASGYAISVMQVGGPSAYSGGNRQFVAASTYKLYVAYAVFQEVAAGRMSWSDSINGKTAAQCFDDMIVVSDNPCAVAFGRQIGWGAINTMIHAIGVSSATQLGSTMYTTPNDLAYLLYRVQNGSIVSAADKNRLIGAMKRQSYSRAGIPAGVHGTVADKVGQVDGYLHDAAIVYSGSKTYILIVMSYGGTWQGIANAAGQVDAYLNR